MARTADFRATLAASFVVVFLLFITAVLWALLSSLRPAESTIASHRAEVDLSKLEPGEVLRFQWETYEIFVLHRTAEQIQWLKAYAAPAAQGTVARERVPQQFQNSFRSLKPEYLVVGIWRHGVALSLREIASYYQCDEFRYDSQPLKLAEEIDWPASFYCTKSYGREIEDLTKSWAVYDPAGRNKNPWLAPLDIPPHFFRNGNVLVLDYAA
jgi:Rieske Fe-S protein